MRQKVFKIITVIFITLAVLLWIMTIVGWLLTEPGFEPLNVLVSAILSTLVGILGWLKSEQTSIPKSDSGGDNMTINAFLGQLNYSLINANSPQERSSYFEQILSLDPTRAQYDKEQFSAYRDIWKTLQRLKFAADGLWKEANEQNMARFFEHLVTTRKYVYDNAPFFEEHHYQKLCLVLGKFDAYGLGKEGVVRIYAAIGGKEELPKWNAQTRSRVANQVEKNRQIKETYESLLEEILISFRDKLSGRHQAGA